MPMQRRLLIVIADGEHARFVRPGSNNALHTERTFDATTAHKRSADLGSDRPGASFHSDSTAHHAVAPRHDLHELEKEKFADSVGTEINQATEYDELVLVAPSRSLNRIRKALDTVVASRIVGTVAKDLVKVPDDALWSHVKEWVQPVHRAPG